MAPLDRTYRLNAKIEAENNVSAAITSATAELDAFERHVNALDATAKVNVRVDTLGAERDLADFERRVSDARLGNINVRVDADVFSASLKLQSIEDQADRLDGRLVTIRVDVDSSGATPELTALSTRLAALGRNRRIRVDVDVDENSFGRARREMDSLGNSAVAGGFRTRLLAAGIAVAIPIVAAFVTALAPAIAGLATLAGTAGIAVGGLGLLGGAFARMVQGVKDGEVGFERLRARLENFKNTASVAFLPAALEVGRLSGDVLQLANRVMPLLGQASLRTANTTREVFAELRREFASSGREANSFRRILEETPRIFGALTAAVGRFGGGLLNVFSASLPAIIRFAVYLADISQQFLEWSRTARAREQIDRFLRSAAPVALALARAIGTIGAALIDVGIRYGPQAAQFLVGFGRVIAVLVRGAGQLTAAVVAVGGAIGRIGAAIDRATRPGTALRIALTGVAVALGLLIGGPVGAAVGALVSIGVALTSAWRNSERFRTAVTSVGLAVERGLTRAAEVAGNVFNRVWPSIERGARVAANIVSGAVMDIVGVFRRNWPAISDVVSRISQQVVDVVQRAWPVVSRTILAAAQGIIRWFQQNWPLILRTIDTVIKEVVQVLDFFSRMWARHGDTISRIVSSLWDTVSRIIMGAVRIIGGIITTFLGVVTGDWESVWRGLGDIVGGVADIIMATVEGMVERVLAVLEGLYEGALAGFGDLYDRLVGNSIVPDMARDIVGVFGEMGDRSARALADLPEKVSRPFRRAQEEASRAATLPQMRQEGPAVAPVTRNPLAQLSDEGTRSVRNLTSAVDRDGERMERDFRRRLENMHKGGGKELDDLSKTGGRASDKLRKDVIDNTEKMSKDHDSKMRGMRRNSDREFTGIEREGSQSSEKLKDNSTRAFDTMGRMNTRHMTTMQTQGTRQFDTFRANGTRHSTALQQGATRQLDLARANVVRSATQANTEGSRQLDTLRGTGIRHMTDLQTQGSRQAETFRANGVRAMEAAGREMPPPVGQAKDTTLGFLDDMLAGMRKFAEETGVSVKINSGSVGSAGMGTPDSGSANVKEFASGGLVDSPTRALIGEAGPEIIIPLSPERRDRGLELLEIAAKHLNNEDPYPDATPEQRSRADADRMGIPPGTRMEAFGPTMYTLIPALKAVADAVANQFGTPWNTYSNHPPGFEQPYYRERSVDWWGPPGRGTPIGSVWPQVSSEARRRLGGNLDWELNPSNDPGGHWDHIHMTAFTGGGAQGASGPDYGALIEKLIPPVPKDWPQHIMGEAGKQISTDYRQQVVDGLRMNSPTASGPDGAGFSGGGSSGANQELGRRMNEAAGWAAHWSSLQELWMRESGWNHLADNPTSDAYGIPQALPGSKMASAGADWQTNPATQIEWGLGYIRDRYGDPSGALGFHDANGWYTSGGIATKPQIAAVAENGPEFFMPLHDPQSARQFWNFIKEVAPMSEDNIERREIVRGTVETAQNTRMLASGGSSVSQTARLNQVSRQGDGEKTAKEVQNLRGTMERGNRDQSRDFERNITGLRDRTERGLRDVRDRVTRSVEDLGQLSERIGQQTNSGVQGLRGIMDAVRGVVQGQGASISQNAAMTGELLGVTKRVWGLARGGKVTGPTAAALGEEPGSTEWVITNSPQHRQRSETLLRDLSDELGFDVIRRPLEGIPAGPTSGSGGWLSWDLLNGRVGTYDPRGGVSGTVLDAMTGWNRSVGAKFLPNYGGNPSMRISGSNPGGGFAGMTHSDGRIDLDLSMTGGGSNPLALATHELGHALGMAHNSAHSIMNYDTMYHVGGRPTPWDVGLVSGRYGGGTGYAPRLPGYAEGGLAVRSQTARVAEAGPELMLPLSNPTTIRRFIESVMDALGGQDTNNQQLATSQQVARNTERTADSVSKMSDTLTSSESNRTISGMDIRTQERIRTQIHTGTQQSGTGGYQRASSGDVITPQRDGTETLQRELVESRQSNERGLGEVGNRIGRLEGAMRNMAREMGREMGGFMDDFADSPRMGAKVNTHVTRLGSSRSIGRRS